MDMRVARCVLLAHVLSADGIMTPEEKELLTRVMASVALTPHEREAVHSMTNLDVALDAARVLPEADRRRILDELLEAALVDGKLSPHETKAIEEFTSGLGL